MARRDLIRDIIIFLVIILALILVRIFFFSTFKITDKTANSYLKSGDLVTVATRRSVLDKDFVVYTIDGKEYMGRIVAQPGQTVTSMDDVLYVDGEVKEEDYLKRQKADFMKTAQPGQLFTDDFTTQTISGKDNLNKIPKNSYLILNDNRRDKKDSRTFGFISKEQIKGVISFRILPLDRFGFVTVE
ncbi:signal peptidase I [Streptococcus dentapri]|uniref:Signal peptidase I n=1 Tax=Streptococcus dentapri TaxID=573564 RepID=A0ABV8D0F6_9STRE